MQGALESLAKGRGQDLYALRDYQPRDSSRHVHWKASARLGSLMVREFTREDDCRVILVLDPHSSAGLAAKEADARFERAVTMCAALAWHFYERNAVLQFRTAGFETPLVDADEIIFDILKHLATAKPYPPDPKRALLSDLARHARDFSRDCHQRIARLYPFEHLEPVLGHLPRRSGALDEFSPLLSWLPRQLCENTA